MDSSQVQQAQIDVSIIVISYNTREMTLEALRSVFRETVETRFELIVVDNASSDGSAEAIAGEFPDIRLLAETENHGFARANNLAAQYASGEFLLLLNPDTVVLDNAIDRLVAFARERPQAGIWGGRTLFGDRSLNPTSCWRRMTLWNVFCRVSGLARMFRNSGFFNSEAYGGWSRDSVRSVDIVTGCFFLITNRLWKELGGFSPEFFMYGEEADLCLRSRRLGMRPAVTHEATIIHYGGASEKVRADKMVRIMRAKTHLMYCHWARPKFYLGLALYYLWVYSRVVFYRMLKILKPAGTASDDYDAWRSLWHARSVWARGFRAI